MPEFQKGNRFWEQRSSHGRKPKFDCPNQLWDACCEYFNWVQDNPLLDYSLVSYKGDSQLEPVPKMRAMTISSLCYFLDISDETWRKYRQKPDFVGVIKNAEKVIYDQKFTGASAGFLKENIIARDLGLADKFKTENEHTINRTPDEMSDDELASIASGSS